jgi:hypothetical protein
MCGGPTATQDELQSEEAAFYKKQIEAYDTAYANFSELQNTLKAQFAPILAAGSEQMGYSPEELAALRTQSTEGTARNYDKAQRALQQNIAAQGGGTSPVNMTGGPAAQIKSELASAAAQEASGEQLGITTSGYDVGRQKWQQAVQGEEALAAGWNPNSFSGSATNAGGLANSEANTIAAQQNSIWNSVIGGLSGIAGSAAGGWATSGFKAPSGWSSPKPATA